MSVLSKDEIMEQLKARIGVATDDDTLKFVEDFTDTIDDYEKKVNGDNEDWKAKYEENDKAWREKYRERFFNGAPKGDDNDNDNDDNGEQDKTAPKTFDELFK